MILLPLIIWLYAFKGFDLATTFKYFIIVHIVAGLIISWIITRKLHKNM